jgi:predicted secreted acid phosphatase
MLLNKWLSPQKSKRVCGKVSKNKQGVEKSVGILMIQGKKTKPEVHSSQRGIRDASLKLKPAESFLFSKGVNKSKRHLT